MKKIFSFFICLFYLQSQGQTFPREYDTFIKKADSLYKIKDYKKSAQSYSSAFKTIKWRYIPSIGYMNDSYNAAKAWAMVGITDSSFNNLERAIKKLSFTDYKKLSKEEAFNSMHSDSRWEDLLDFIKDYSKPDVPHGWIIAGSRPKSYQIGLEKNAGQDGKNAATIKSIDNYIDGFGNLMQSFTPKNYLGKRLRMTGYMKTKDVYEWASFWMRVDGKDKGQSLTFDNMKDGKEDRSLKGTQDWTKCEIVLDVPDSATNISFGVMLGGTGQIWIDNLKIEVVDKSVSVTDITKNLKKEEPVNLDFEK